MDRRLLWREYGETIQVHAASKVECDVTLKFARWTNGTVLTDIAMDVFKLVQDLLALWCIQLRFPTR